MSTKIQVDLDEVKQLFCLLEKLHAFLHQPLHYGDQVTVTKLLQSNIYEELRGMYYDVVWHWLPPDVQREMEDR